MDLVDVLPEEGSSGEGLTMLWKCADQAECVDVCRDLKSADIPYYVDQIPYEKTARMGVRWRYRILISRNDLDRAKRLLSIDAPQNTIPSDDEDEEVVDPTVELADADAPLAVGSKSRETYLDAWYPEDATVEVWSRDAGNFSSQIEVALDANCIHFRCDSDESGARKLFVRPEDGPFAREIVREIIEGTPLK